MKEIQSLIAQLIKIKEIEPGFTGCIAINIHREKPGAIQITKTKNCKELKK